MICFATREASPSLWMEFTNRKHFWLYTRENKAGTLFRTARLLLQVRAFWFLSFWIDFASFRHYPAFYAARCFRRQSFSAYSCAPPLLKIVVCYESYVKAFSFLFFAGKVLSNRRLDVLSVRLLKQSRHMNAYRNNTLPSTEFICFNFFIWPTHSSVAVKLTNSSQFCRHRHLSDLRKTFSFTACCNWDLLSFFMPPRQAIACSWCTSARNVTLLSRSRMTKAWRFSRDLVWLW